MTAPSESSVQTLYKHWSSAASSLLTCQWKLFEVQYQAGLKILEAALCPTDDGAQPGPSAASPRTAAELANAEVKKLERLAAERVSQGLAPPREVYQVPYRNQIDWARFPLWARPNDPELFEGAGHEG